MQWILSLLVVWIAASWAALGTVCAQEVETPPLARLGSLLGDDQTVTIADIQAAIEQLGRATDIDEATRTRASESLQAALKSLEAIEPVAGRQAEFERLLQTIERQMQDASAQLAQLAKEQVSIDEQVPTEQLQQWLVQYQVELDTARRQLAAAEAEPERQRQRLTEIPVRMAERQRELDEINRQLAAAVRPDEPPWISRTRAMQLTAQKQLLEREQQRATAEQAWYLGAVNLLPEQLRVAQQQVRLATERWQKTQLLVQTRQESDAQRTVREARQDLQQAPPALTPLAESNVKLAELYLEQLNRLARDQQRWRTTREQLTTTTQQYETTKERVQSVGLTDALGVHLKEVRQSLLRTRNQHRPEPQLKDEMSRLRIDSFRRQDDLAAWKSVDDAAELELNRASFSAEDRERQRPLVGRMVARRQQLNQEMVNLDNRLLESLVNLDTSQRELQAQIDRFVGFIDENIIWIPSCSPLAWSDVAHASRGAIWLFDVAHWQGLAGQAVQGARQRPLALAGFFLSLALLFGLHRRFRNLVLESSDEAIRGRCTSMLPTWNALLATLLMAARWPMTFAFLGWLMRVALPGSAFSQAWGQAMLSIALLIAPFEMLRLTCRQKGLAAAHFDWPDSMRRFFQRHVRWIYLIGAPAVAVMVALEHQSEDAWRDSLGRMAAVVLFLVATWFLHLALKPHGPVFHQMSQHTPPSLIYRWRFMIYLSICAVPIILLLLAVTGYYYTAFKLAGCLERSAVLAVVLTLAGGLSFRWLLIRRRAIAIEELRKMRAQQQSAAESAATAGMEVASIEIPDEPALDLASVSQQAKEIVVFLLGICGLATLWWIWQEVLPAIGMLRRVELWQSTVGQNLVPVTLQDLVYAAVIVGFMLIVIRNLSGILNLVFHSFFALDGGARYAATMLIRYLIIIVGMVAALGFLKIAWSQYGWLVAAASVGLGFGLQEIFANFVSGIILLFERPVRVGDVVTLDNQTGIVTRIQMRATTITNWDYQELVVPNKNLVTGSLLNWSLTSGMNRVVIEIGVGYDADPVQVQRLLLEAASAHPDVLQDPPPSAYFDRFGDNALIFLVRVYSARLDCRINIRHEVNSLILAKLTGAGIKIPYPQREVHLTPPAAKGAG